MSTSQIKSGGVVTFEISVAGSAISDSYQVYAIHVSKSLNRIATATITLLDGDPSEESFAVSSASTFVPGNEVTIEAGYDCENKTIFTGIITKQSLSVDSTSGPMLHVICKDKAIKMSVGRKNAAFNSVTDSDAITTIIGNYSGLTADVTSTTNTQDDLIQYYVTDWDFMLSRAEVNSMVVATLNGKVSVFKPDANTDSVLTITYGQNLYEFNAELNSVNQLAEVKASAWDYQNQQIISEQVSNSNSGAGNLTSKTLSEVVGLSDFELQTTAAENNDDLTAWANAQVLKSSLAKIIGEVRFQGDASVDLGNYITIDGMGDRFDGDHLVSALTHDISHGNWFTEASLGLSATWFVQEKDVISAPAAGLLPGIEGLFNATVKQINDDPDNEYRVLLDIPLFNDEQGIWARLTNFYSTNGAGAFFMPEVGDEVIVGFLNQDPRYPVILGSVYSEKNKPYSELTPNENNTTKAIVTKSELRILFDDENKVLTLLTPSENTIVLDDQNKQISIKDQNSNSIVMSESGIAIKSASDISIEADQQVTIKGQTGVTVEASGGDVKVSGMNISQEADMEYSAKGSMTAEVQGGTELTLKGAMVMIN